MVRSSSQHFDEFVKREQELVAAGKEVDWAKERDRWLENLELLYEKIHSYLEEYIEKGSIRIEYEPINLTEENIGAYQARKQIINIGSQTIVLTPIGTMLIGSKGRVDVKGRAGAARFLMVDKSADGASSLINIRIVDPKSPPTPKKETKPPIEWTWKIASSPPVLQFVELNKESLRQLLLEVSNG